MDTTNSKTNKVVVISKEVAEAAIELEQIRTFVNNMKKRETELRKMILDEVQRGEDGYYDGKRMVAVTTSNRTELDKKGLIAKHPEVANWFADFTVAKPTAVVETFNLT